MNGQRVILLVEDDPDDEQLIVRALTRSGIKNKIDVVRDGVEALDYLFGTGAYAGHETRTLPVAMLLDLKLPKLSGLAVLQRVRADERTRLLPVVVLTSSSEARDKVESYRLGANSYVRKPVEFDEFRHAVHQLGLYWLLINEPPPSAR